MFRAIFGPMPLTVLMSRRNNSRSAAVRKPGRMRASSRMARWVSSFTSFPGAGSLSNEERGMRISYPTPWTSTVTCVGRASMSLPCKKLIMIETVARLAASLNSFARGERVTPVLLRVSQRQGQRVRGIGRGRFGQVEHPLHHFGGGEFLRRALTDNGLLHLARRDFVNLQAPLANGGQARPAPLPPAQGRLPISR